MSHDRYLLIANQLRNLAFAIEGHAKIDVVTRRSWAAALTGHAEYLEAPQDAGESGVGSRERGATLASTASG